QSMEAQRWQLLDAYITRMIARRGISDGYEVRQIVHWLTRLAQSMQRQGQSVFFIENLQPTWLASRAAVIRYGLFDRLCSALVLGLGSTIVSLIITGGQGSMTALLGRFSGLGSFGPIISTPFPGIMNSINGGLLGAMLGGLFGGKPPSPRTSPRGFSRLVWDG